MSGKEAIGQVPVHGNGSLEMRVKREGGEILPETTIGDLNKNSGRQLEETWLILKDPSNADHLADISPNTSLPDITRYYSDPSRKAVRIASDKEARVVGVYDISGNPPSYVSNLSSEERPGVSIVSGWINRLCVKPDQQSVGIGSLLIRDAEEQALGKLDFTVLRAAIVLSEDQMHFYEAIALTMDMQEIENALAEKEITLHQGQIDLYTTLRTNEDFSPQQKAYHFKSVGTEIFLDWLALTDPRGRAFIKNSGWKFNTIYGEQTRVESTGKNHPVLIVEKYKSDWEEEQREKKRRTHKKVINVQQRVPRGVRKNLL